MTSNIFLIIITTAFSVYGVRYVDTLDSFNQFVIPTLCLVVPVLVVAVLVAAQQLREFFAAGFRESERRIKEQRRHANPYR